MELGTALVGIIVALICIVPFVVLNIKKKKREKEILQSLYSLATEHNCNISDYDVWNHSSIGIDDHNQYLFYTRMIKNNLETHSIKLSEVQRSSVSKINRTVKTEDSSFEIIDRVELVLSLQYNNVADEVLELYNASYDKPTVTFELELADKWCNLINKRIPSTVKQSL